MIAREPLNNIFNELYLKRFEHWEDRQSGIKGWEIEPDLQKYRMLDSLGMLFCYVARIDGKIVGYFSAITSPALHHKTKKVANHDLLFVDPAYKKSGIARRLIKFACEDLKANGFDAMFAISIEDEKLKRFWKIHGFQPVGAYLMRSLKDGS